MPETFAELTARVKDDPTFTQEELEDEIGCCLCNIVSPIFQDITVGQDTMLLKQAIQERFGLGCEILPAASIHVSVGDTPNPDIIATPTLPPFEEALEAIMEKDFSAMAPEKVLELLGNTINNGCRYFLDTVIFPNPRLAEIFKRFMETFGTHIVVLTKSMVTVCPGEDASDTSPTEIFGTYL